MTPIQLKRENLKPQIAHDELRFVTTDAGYRYNMIRELGLILTHNFIEHDRHCVAIEHPDHGEFDLFVARDELELKRRLEELLLRFDPTLYNAWLEMNNKHPVPPTP